MSWDTVKLAAVAEINPRMPRGLADDLDVAFLPMAAISEGGQIDYAPSSDSQASMRKKINIS